MQQTIYILPCVCIADGPDGSTEKCDNHSALPPTPDRAADMAPNEGYTESVHARAGMQREAAHNLALIYQASGADDLAREVLRLHLRV